MTAEEYFRAVLQAVKDIGLARMRLDTVRIGRSGQGGRPSGISDPTGQMAQAIIKAEQDLELSIKGMEQTIADGKQTINGVGKALGQRAAAILHLRYIDAKPWKQVARELDLSASRVYEEHRAALDWVDFVGIANAKLGRGRAEE